MKVTSLRILALVAIGCIGIQSAQANLVTNSGFETGNFSGWTQSGNLGFTSVSGGVFANSGTYGAAFGPVGSDGFISQTLATTAGASYNVSFWLANFGGTPNHFSATFDGNNVLSFVNSGTFGYTQYSYLVLASTNSTVLSFGFMQNPSYWGIDDVSVEQARGVPDTGSAVVLLGSALIGFAALRRRLA